MSYKPTSDFFEQISAISLRTGHGLQKVKLDSFEIIGMWPRALTSKECDFTDFWCQMAQKWRKEEGLEE